MLMNKLQFFAVCCHYECMPGKNIVQQAQKKQMFHKSPYGLTKKNVHFNGNFPICNGIFCLENNIYCFKKHILYIFHIFCSFKLSQHDPDENTKNTQLQQIIFFVFNGTFHLKKSMNI